MTPFSPNSKIGKVSPILITNNADPDNKIVNDLVKSPTTPQKGKSGSEYGQDSATSNSNRNDISMRTRKKIARNQSANQGPAQSYLSQFEGSPTKKDGQQLIADENSKSLLIENYNLSRANFPGNSGPQQPHLANLQGSHRISQLTKTANTKRFFYLFEKGNSVFDFDIYFHEFSKFSCLEEILPEIDIKKSKLIKFLFTGYSMGSQF